ncbi:GNAT family N-acetyltransferase [Selenomonas ruminantium]|uniref:GNAT family N-acetyltransferase n=1 Tax=Selenomonas ruminantium TaxID=971 RepID=UPI0005A4ED89
METALVRIYKELDKWKHRHLLLLADEQESMVEKYLASGTMYVLEDSGVKAECVVTDEGNHVLEIKNIAVMPKSQGYGYGKKLIGFLVKQYAGNYDYIQGGTGDSPLTIPFYEHCGFTRYDVRKNFFLDNYDHVIVEGGKQLVDMVLLHRKI